MNSEYTIELIISQGDFEQTFKRPPQDEDEFQQFCKLCEKGLKNGHIDWKIIFSCAKDAI